MSCCAGDTTDLAKQIGIGPTLFLLSTKALAFFFLFISILSVPIMGFYYNGNPDNAGGTGIVDSYFAMLSLGNVGSNDKLLII